VHLAGLEQVDLIVRVRACRRDEAQRLAAFGAQRLRPGSGVQVSQRRRRPDALEPRPQRIVDRMG